MSPRDYDFTGPDRAVRFARRMRRRRQGGPPGLVGVVLVFLGVLFLLENLNLIEARSLLRTYWPALLVAWGVARLLSGRRGERVFGGTAIVAGGLLLSNRLLGWDIEIWRIFWPLLLIALGVHFLVHSRRRSAHPRMHDPSPSDASAVDADEIGPGQDEVADESATFTQLAFMASVQRKNVSQALRGGRVNAFMGAAVIDLRECRMASGEVLVDVFTMMGEVVLRIPRDWAVDSRVSAVMASVEDRADVPADASAKRLVVHGSAFMGNVEITN